MYIKCLTIFLLLIEIQSLKDAAETSEKELQKAQKVNTTLFSYYHLSANEVIDLFLIFDLNKTGWNFLLA
jgi:hypothetical protein